MTWEYYVIEVSERFVSDVDLNGLGEDGWELVAVVSSDRFYLYFKRPKLPTTG